MFFLNERQHKIKEVVKTFGCAKIKHLEDITQINGIEELMIPAISQWNSDIVLEDDILHMKNVPINPKTLKIVELYAILSKNVDVEWFLPLERGFPFEASAFFNNNVFDIAIVEEGQELSFGSAIERNIPAKKVILLIENQEQIPIINTVIRTKQVKFCLMKPIFKFIR